MELHICRFCSKTYDDYHRLGNHVRRCESNPNYLKNIQSQKDSGLRRRNRVTLNLFCAKCNTPFVVEALPYEIKNNKYPKNCSRSCANGRTKTENQKLAASIIAIGRANKNRKVRPKCLYCDNYVKQVYNKYCSPKCRTLCPINRANLSIRTKERLLKNPSLHPNIRCAGIKESYPERIFKEYLESSGLVKGKDFITQYSCERFFVDFYFPSINIGVEIDGERWHRDVERDNDREKIIEKHFQLIRFKAKPLIKKEYQNAIDYLIYLVKENSLTK